MSQNPGHTGFSADNGFVAHTDIEPGLIRLFRWYVAVRLALLVFLQLIGQDRAAGDPLFVPEPGIIILGFLFIYLATHRLQARLGRKYLPIALWVAAIGPIVESRITIIARLAEGASANEAIADYWLLFFYLFVPLIFVAWQYRFRWVLFFSVGTFFLEAALTIPPLEDMGADLALLGGLMLGRATLFTFVGLVITKLVSALRLQREALAEGAIARERLAMSEERRRLARELHDTLAHTLSAVAVQLEGVNSIWDDDPATARQMIERSLASTRSGLTEARQSITALRSSALEEHGLTKALEELCRSVTDTSTVDATFVDDSRGVRLASDVEHTVYTIAREALTNVVRHADATNARVRLDTGDRRLVLSVQDDGTGIGPDEAIGADHHGVTGMYERADLIGANLVIRSNGHSGTTVELTMETRR